ncbi:MAG: hypothetical protein ACXAB7_08375 [Candidatus Kariarchaeaceae archaeon]|jgi:hypothetical protein
MKILVFTEGTVIMHQNAKDLARGEIVAQSFTGIDPSLLAWVDYIPIGNAVQKLRTWKEQSVQIMYLTSRKVESDVTAIQKVLKKNRFPEGTLYFRAPGQEYKDIAEKLEPDVLIEDDCESIGGKSEMTYTNIGEEFKRRIKLIKVAEFQGIDHLPDDIGLLNYV